MDFNNLYDVTFLAICISTTVLMVALFVLSIKSLIASIKLKFNRSMKITAVVLLAACSGYFWIIWEVWQTILT